MFPACLARLSCVERLACAHEVRCSLVEVFTTHGAGASGTADVALSQRRVRRVSTGKSSTVKSGRNAAQHPSEPLNCPQTHNTRSRHTAKNIIIYSLFFHFLLYISASGMRPCLHGLVDTGERRKVTPLKAWLLAHHGAVRPRLRINRCVRESGIGVGAGV